MKGIGASFVCVVEQLTNGVLSSSIYIVAPRRIFSSTKRRRGRREENRRRSNLVRCFLFDLLLCGFSRKKTFFFDRTQSKPKDESNSSLSSTDKRRETMTKTKTKTNGKTSVPCQSSFIFLSTSENVASNSLRREGKSSEDRTIPLPPNDSSKRTKRETSLSRREDCSLTVPHSTSVGMFVRRRAGSTRYRFVGSFQLKRQGEETKLHASTRRWEGGGGETDLSFDPTAQWMKTASEGNDAARASSIGFSALTQSGHLKKNEERRMKSKVGADPEQTSCVRWHPWNHRRERRFVCFCHISRSSLSTLRNRRRNVSSCSPPNSS